MKNTNKIVILLINILMSISLSACSPTKITENGEVDATTNITWNSKTEEINVSTVTIKCNDNYYGVIVNDSINFNNDNNYFTTGEGLLVQITDNEDTLVSSNNYTYSYKATIEDNVSLYVSGNDEDKIKEVFNNVFKTNKESYQMFSHDINNDWINNVIITSDVVSFFNGTVTTYIYQNEGSLSPGSFEGKVEPTVFKKQLRGIDIPITYPEDTEGVSNYIPYGAQTYEHWSNEGYTPYSAYTISNDVYDATIQHNFIILANNDNNVLNLFEEKNDHTQKLYSLSLSSAKINSTTEIKKENISSKKDIATSVINSDNRYHFGVLSKSDTYLTQWTESNKDGYYVDGNTYSNNKIAGEMIGKLVAPTLKISVPVYSSNNDTLIQYGKRVLYINTSIYSSTYDYAYAIGGGQTDTYGTTGFGGHGTNISASKLIDFDITGLNYDNSGKYNFGFMSQYFIYEGDYIYYLSNSKLFIYKNVSTFIQIDDYGGGIGYSDSTYPIGKATGLSLHGKNGYVNTESCFAGGTNNLEQVYKVVSKVEY